MVRHIEEGVLVRWLEPWCREGERCESAGFQAPSSYRRAGSVLGRRGCCIRSFTAVVRLLIRVHHIEEGVLVRWTHCVGRGRGVSRHTHMDIVGLVQLASHSPKVGETF